eukprot:TRINITY_DN3155_c0_g1_i1.p1 TRINITY_DN3155_c0_g1~~TRINITY_DN3155_c0_g1_i1.p1  ORF type:complete len:352 (-),score=51.75 TRINITY_DN3155_c0_g1_i1:42-1097(-)
MEVPHFPLSVYEGLERGEGPLVVHPDTVFQSDVWLQYFRKFTSRAWMDSVGGGCRTRVHHGVRMIIQHGTLEALTKGYYLLEDGTKVVLDMEKIKENVLKTKLYKEAPDFQIQETYDTIVEVVEGDCLEVAEFMKSIGYNPFCLNMANANSPGGGYMHGAGAQEENLHRRTGLCHSLRDPQKIQGPKGGSYNYPIPESGVIYSPDVVVLRSGEASGYKFKTSPLYMSFISCPAINKPKLKPGSLEMSSAPTEIMISKLKNLLSVGVIAGHDVAVLCAIGCGAFRCPPGHIARLFKQLLDNEFKGAYKRVVFAIYNDHNSKGGGNVAPFASTFGLEDAVTFETYSKITKKID